MSCVVVLQDYDAWMAPEVSDTEALRRLLQSYPAKKMAGYPVSRGVNNPRNQGPSLT